ncbi:MAG TPA: O-methyltransferase [Candidatus Baltobacteraceae bacterium]|jgi:caffeoyl-CoA O-methyltransferase|nr:O-methyltransferase [Candidatus Baltobacteraceae bacterium]
MHEVSGYLEAAHPEPHPLLLELEQYGRQEAIAAVPREVGRVLSTLVVGMQANRILEIGTAYGYATLWMALAQPPAGKIWTFDPDMERTAIALSYFQRANEDDNIEIINQPALDVLPVFPQRNMDIVFVDAQRSQYAAFMQYCFPLLKLSGLLIFNNLLRDDRTLEFTREFLHHPELDATILPIGSGLGIGARKR